MAALPGRAPNQRISDALELAFKSTPFGILADAPLRAGPAPSDAPPRLGEPYVPTLRPVPKRPPSPLANPPLTGRDAIIREKAFDAFFNIDTPGPNHSFLEIVDPVSGKTWIARGGPNGRGLLEPVKKAFANELYVVGEVKPEAESKDAPALRAEKTTHLLGTTVVRGRSAASIVRQADAYTRAITDAQNHYDNEHNSNSVAHGLFRQITGTDFSAPEQWGAGTALRTAPLPPSRMSDAPSQTKWVPQPPSTLPRHLPYR
jgi:hypothetical protein